MRILSLALLILFSFSSFSQGLIVNPYRFGASAPVTLNTGLVAYWKLDEASGTAVDDSGANDLTAVNNPVSTTGKISNARLFVSASNQYLELATHPLTGATTWTMAAWVSLTTAGNFPMIFSSGDFSASLFLDLRFNGISRIPQITVKTSGSSATVTSASAITTGTFYHIAGVYDGTHLRLYVDGSEVGTPAACTTPLIPTELWIGGRSDGLRINGAIDEAGIWNRALSSSEISDLYNAGSGVTCCAFP